MEHIYEEDLPKSIPVSQVREGDWFLTNAVWRNSYGSFQPETGVRFMNLFGPDERPLFELIEHGWRDFDAANDVIIKGLRKGWGTGRIADLMTNLKRRRKSRPKVL